MTDFSPRSGTMQAGLAKQQQGHHPTVLNRLQGFLSPRQQAAAMTRPGDTSTPTPSPRKPLPIDPRFLKVRILTWNMHDSLPKGDLEELLGKVPAYNAPASDYQFPHLLNDGSHPYHIVVIAGQECPTPSGIPMGLGAGFKILDKDRDKSKDVDKDHDKVSFKIKDKHDDSRSQKHDDESDAPPIGWTSIVEDWLCNGSGQCRPSSPTIADVGFPRPLIRQKSSKEARKGPYQLLIKDRLMGIYLAVYIHRDLKPFVQGTSKSAVTAGLIGGRVGNKGGVGISMKVDGTTFLFLNAHLAAHEGKIHHRQANLAKIKSQLSVDDFLPSTDPRKAAEDPSDRFDFAFLCGDLNFRLNISRLHADWLIERGEYAQAFEFDQLQELMKKGDTFTGYHEAPINFPPTFKYDVLRSLKSSKRSSSKRSRIDERFIQIAEKEERERETQDEDGDEDAASIVSTATGVTSINSQSAPEPETNNFAYLSSLPPTPVTTRARSTSIIPTTPTSVRKAKAKFLSLLSPSLGNAPDKQLKINSTPDLLTVPIPTTPTGRISPSSLARRISPKIPGVFKKSHRPAPMILVNSPGSSSPRKTSLLEDVITAEKGVYDSSSKKRVPSWCDRILWKTTIVPPRVFLEDYIQDPDIPRPRKRMGQFFANAFRPPHSRTDMTHPTSSQFLGSATPTSPYSFNSSATTQGHSTPFSTNSRQSNNITYKPFNTPSRRANTAYSPPPTAPLPLETHVPRRGTDLSEGFERPHTATHQFTWRGLLPSFLSPTYTQGPPQDIVPTTPAMPVKGEVKCLTYNTLDDRGMRRLEGRSDHRPVIGAYIVYV